MAQIAGTKIEAQGQGLGDTLMLRPMVKLSFSEPLLSPEDGCATRLGLLCSWTSNGLPGRSREPGEDFRCSNREENKIALCLSS